MASEPLMFVTGSKTFEITHFSMVRTIGNKNYIESERFTVGGYDWVIEFYLQGIKESLSVNVSSVAVRVLNPMEEFQATCCVRLWHWADSKWVGETNNNFQSGLVTFSSSGDNNALCRWSFDYFYSFPPHLIANYVKDETVRIKCALCVTPRPPSPTSAVKPDVDKADDNGNQGNPSGANSSFNNGFHTADYAPPNGPNNTKMPRQPTIRIYCKANKDLSLTIRNGTVVLAPANSNDYYQHWIKDMTYGDKVKDEDGFPAFALVNRVTGEALQNPAGENEVATLVSYNRNCLDDSVKWTEVWSTGFRAIRVADTASLNLTAVGSDNDTNFSDGAKIVVKKWVNSPVQRWMIVPNVPC